MRLAFVTELFAPSVGGQEIRFEELGAELVKRGIQVDLYTIRHDLATSKLETRSGIAVHRIADCAGYKHPRLRRHPLGILAFTHALWRRRSELRACDAVVFNIWPILPSLALATQLRGKTVVDVCETRSGRLWHWVYRCIAALPQARILGVSPQIGRHMQRVHGVQPQRTHVAVSGVDLAAAASPPFHKNPRQILFFGRLTEHKNPDLLAEAFERSSLPRRGYELVVAGDGPEFDRLRRRFESPSIRFPGRVSEAEKWALLRRSSLLVLPSRREGFPRVVAEAACVGTPTLTLAYPDNGTRFVVEDFGVGRSVAPDIDALVAALDRFAGAGAGARGLRLGAGHEPAARFSGPEGMMHKVLLTGGAGFIGSHVADLLLERGCELTILDNLSFGRRTQLDPRARFAEVDLTDRAGVAECLRERFDTVIHLAAIHFIPYCNEHPHLACRTNIEGTQNVFDAAIAGGSVQRLFMASTAAWTPGSDRGDPGRPPRAPLDVYGMTKSANEDQAAILALRSSIHVSVGRFFNAVGGRETNPHLVPDILRRLKQSDTIEIGNTTPRRDYIDVRDMARGVLAMLDGNDARIDTCNIGSGEAYDVVEIARFLSDIHGSTIRLQAVDRLMRKVERQNLQADPSRLRARYGWSPRYTITDSLRYAHETFTSV
jgi:UDP-glucose 4-epimerase